MKIVGLITEYNPFHKGHEYHIKRAKELTGADACVVIMSGNYVQRGTPAFMDKHTRTSIALKHGADVVFELPLPFSCSSAEYFAAGAVTLLQKMGCISHICFGTECSDIDKLKNVAYILADAKREVSHPLNHYIKENVKSGMSYAAARSHALNQYIAKRDNIPSNSYTSVDHTTHSMSDATLLDTPNNILAIEYLKALRLLDSEIIPVAIERTKAAYHHDEANDCLYSASSIRNAINKYTAFHSPVNYTSREDYKKNSSENIEIYEAERCPDDIFSELLDFSPEYNTVLGKTAPITENDFSAVLTEKLLAEHMIKHKHCSSTCDLADYMGIDNDLANRITNRSILLNHTDFTDIADKLKTKNIAYTSVSRALLAITLGITKADVEAYIENDISSYIRLLGFKKEASTVLNEIKKKGTLTIIGQLSEINDKCELNDTDKHMICHSIYCDELYNSIIRRKYSCDFPNEYQRKMVIIP